MSASCSFSGVIRPCSTSAWPSKLDLATFGVAIAIVLESLLQLFDLALDVGLELAAEAARGLRAPVRLTRLGGALLLLQRDGEARQRSSGVRGRLERGFVLSDGI